MGTSEIQVDESKTYRLFEKFSRESVLIILVSICMIATLVAVLTAVLAMNSATHAEAKVDYELWATREEATARKNLMVLHNVYLQELYLIMKDAGLEPPPLPEE